MQKFYNVIISNRKKILVLFALLFIVCAVCRQFISVNYDMNDYLPEDSSSTKALNVMGEEFEQTIPNARVMIHNVTLPEALGYKERLEKIDGVLQVTWLDDAIDIKQPLEMQDKSVVEDYYRENTALYTVTVDENKRLSVVSNMRKVIGSDNAMTGSAVSTAVATESTVSEISRIAVIGVLFALLVLILTTTSWMEPFIVLIGIGVAVIINAGTNLVFGEISFVTNAAGNILQLAVSLDYSVFLIHRFEECRKNEPDIERAMNKALCKSTTSILSSGLTTVIGFLALTLMKFKIGPDLGFALAKGIAISLISVFVFMPGFIIATHQWMDKTKHRSFIPEFKEFGKIVRKIAIPVVCIFVILIIPSYLASVNNDYYYGSSHIFDKGTQLGDDTEEIKKIFGKSDTYVLLVPKGNTASETKLCDELKKLSKVTSIISYAEQVGAEIPYEYIDENILNKLESKNYSRIIIQVNADYEGEETVSLINEIKSISSSYYENQYYMAGEGVSTADLMKTVTDDMVKVNLIAIGAVFVVLLLTMKSLILPIILVLTIETAIWINLSIPYYQGAPLFYIAYLIISSVQLGATVDYAILFTDRYKENRKKYDKKQSVVKTVSKVTASILTSGIVLTVVGFLLGKISTHGLLSQLGYLLGKGTICSLVAVLFVLPGLLYIFDGLFIKKSKSERTKLMKLNKSLGNKITSFIMAGVIAATASFGGSLEIKADDDSGSKEEVVYAMLDASGKVSGIYTVNSFGAGDIVDYGDYANVKNLTTDDKINVSGDKITFHTDTEKVYYQGDMKTKNISWNIEIKYFLDDKECAAESLAGKSGKLKMNLSITQNKKCDSSFWEGHALQATMTLDGKKCKNILAENATIANIGSDKQLSYIILPGKGADITVTADVDDFEMNGISLNGVKLDLQFDFDNNKLTDKIQKISEAVSELKTGADNLDSGAATLENGAKDIYQGAETLQMGAGDLGSGISNLNKGIKKIQKSLKKLNGKSKTLTDGSAETLKALKTIQKSLKKVSIDADNLKELSSSSTKIKSGINELVKGLGEIDNNISTYNNSLAKAGISDTADYIEKHNQAIKALNITDTQRQVYDAYLSDGTKGVIAKVKELVSQGDKESQLLYKKYAENANEDVITDYVTECGRLINVEKLLKADISYIKGSSSLVSGIDEVLDDKNGKLMTGAVSLQTNYDTFDKNIQAMTLSLSSLIVNMSELKNGINTLVSNYDQLNKGINNYTKAVAKIFDGYNYIYKGSLTLAKGTSKLYDGTTGLVNGTLALYNGTTELTDGTEKMAKGISEFNEKTDSMDTEVSDAIDETIDNLTGKTLVQNLLCQIKIKMWIQCCL